VQGPAAGARILEWDVRGAPVVSCRLVPDDIPNPATILGEGTPQVTVPDSALELPAQQVEELIRTIAKALRAFQMYLPNNPVYRRSIDALRAAFNPIWAGVPALRLTVTESDLIWEEKVVYHQPSRSESFAWLLYKDGLRHLTLKPGGRGGRDRAFPPDGGAGAAAARGCR
jgi:hypothetical protein